MPTSFPIYIVDDQESVRMLLASICDSQDWAYTTFESGSAFLEASEKLAGGCVILDMRMPGLRGITVQETLKQLGRPFVVIAISGHGDVDMAVESMKLGAVDFIEKPFPVDTIVAAIKQAFARLARTLQV